MAMITGSDPLIGFSRSGYDLRFDATAGAIVFDREAVEISTPCQRLSELAFGHLA